MADPRQAAREWIKLIFPSLNAVIDMDQQTSDAPRPDAPYAGIMLQVSKPDGYQTPVTITDPKDPDPGPPAPGGDQRHGWVRMGDLLVTFYGVGSEDRALELQLSINRADAVELLDGLGVSISNPVTTENSAAILDTSREPRESLVFDVKWYSEITHEVDVIETVVYDVTVEEG